MNMQNKISLDDIKHGEDYYLNSAVYALDTMFAPIKNPEFFINPVKEEFDRARGHVTYAKSLSSFVKNEDLICLISDTYDLMDYAMELADNDMVNELELTARRDALKRRACDLAEELHIDVWDKARYEANQRRDTEIFVRYFRQEKII
jgi:hypothetical protein